MKISFIKNIKLMVFNNWRYAQPCPYEAWLSLKYFAEISGAAFCLLAIFSSPLLAQRNYMEPIKITPTQLTEAYKRNFHQADFDYTGKLLLITGKVKAIRPPQQRPYNYHFDKLYSFMSLEAGNGNRPLAVYFWDWEAERLTPRAKVGSTISVMGFCQGVPPQLSIIEACIYPSGCGGPKEKFKGPYYHLPPSPPPRR